MRGRSTRTAQVGASRTPARASRAWQDGVADYDARTASTTPAGSITTAPAAQVCGRSGAAIPGSGTIEINGRGYMDALPRKNLQEGRQPWKWRRCR
jgi:hypothetical protein